MVEDNAADGDGSFKAFPTNSSKDDSTDNDLKLAEVVDHFCAAAKAKRYVQLSVDTVTSEEMEIIDDAGYQWVLDGNGDDDNNPLLTIWRN